MSIDQFDRCIHIDGIFSLSLVMPSDDPFHSPASSNVIFTAGIYLACIGCRWVGHAPASFAVVNSNFLLTMYIWIHLWNSPINKYQSMYSEYILFVCV